LHTVHRGKRIAATGTGRIRLLVVTSTAKVAFEPKPFFCLTGRGRFGGTEHARAEVP